MGRSIAEELLKEGISPVHHEVKRELIPADNQGTPIIGEYGEKICNYMGCEFPIKPYDDLMFIFPSELKHYVPSYWIDAERISVSGNFVVV